MKILSIGNSFSQDAQRYLNKIALAGGDNIFCANLYIGGCSLERHINNINNDAPEYEYQVNGVESSEKISIKSALLQEKWDIVTLQQVSSYSGIVDTYYPYIDELINYIKTYLPKIEIMLHQTWAYETGSSHGDFPLYNCDRFFMHKKIVDANIAVANKSNLKTIIPSGEIISLLRQTDYFNYDNGGQSLCRDGFHMSYCYGRYALGLCWYMTLTRKSVINNSFNPPIETNDPLYNEKIKVIKKTVEKFML